MGRDTQVVATSPGPSGNKLSTPDELATTGVVQERQNMASLPY